MKRVWATLFALALALAAACAWQTRIFGVGDTITVPVTSPSPGYQLWWQAVPPGERWTIETLNLQLFTEQDTDAQAYIFHVFVIEASGGHCTGPVGSPWWRFAKSPSHGPDFRSPVPYALRLPVAGPACVGFVAVNLTGAPQLLYWSIVVTVEP